MNNKKESYLSFVEKGQRYMQCKSCHDYIEVDNDVTAITCSRCTSILCLKAMPLDEMLPSLNKNKISGRPAGWHFMKEYVDKDGNVFHKGKEQTELKGTLKPTKVKPPKKRKKKKLTADQKLFKEVKEYKKRKKLRKKTK
jgi:hypothetical protein|tara:strand:+ start:1533 stop:1952 length:420 start_codon:yes stop_codon:yes gene_type:complete